MLVYYLNMEATMTRKDIEGFAKIADGPFSFREKHVTGTVTKWTMVSRTTASRADRFYGSDELIENPFTAAHVKQFNATPKAKVVGRFACINCGGTGYIQTFAHIESGVCFACNGKGRR